MSDRTDPMSAAARHINGGGPLAPFLGALTLSALHELASLATAEANARIAAWRATLCDHPPAPGCYSCGAPEGFDGIGTPWRWGGVTHRPGCGHLVGEARESVYSPNGSQRAAARVLDAERERQSRLADRLDAALDALRAVHVAPVEDA